MIIQQITSAVVCGASYVGKWYAADSIPGPDGEPIHRYLQPDGSWGRTTKYFGTEQEVEDALSKGLKPDFSLSKRELFDRREISEKKTMNWLM